MSSTIMTKKPLIENSTVAVMASKTVTSNIIHDLPIFIAVSSLFAPIDKSIKILHF